ncbi:hypothetical protein H4S14_000651 [Agrobacterium vitis]|nr:hypothetical protein [Agrobacterium vitis]MBE1436924.1 hypothetical protein [Agrobacterium vitis]
MYDEMGFAPPHPAAATFSPPGRRDIVDRAELKKQPLSLTRRMRIFKKGMEAFNLPLLPSGEKVAAAG